MAKRTTIETVLATRYDVDAMVCDALTIEWAALYLIEVEGAEFAAAEFRRISHKRERMGRYTTIPAYGTPLYTAWSALVQVDRARREAKAAAKRSASFQF